MSDAKQAHILVADDEELVRAMLRNYLAEQGFRVSVAADGDELRDVFERGNFDLVLLDIMMPGEDGIAIMRYIRRLSEVPVIMLTGRHDPIDRVAGLEAGADDYVTKPFHMREVLARIRTVMRRAKPTASAQGPGAATETIERYGFDGWELDVATRDVLAADGGHILLTAGEFDLLMAFLRHPNRVLSRDQLMDLVKGREWAAYDRAIDALVLRLRKKIERDTKSPGFVKTVHGAGYMFAAKVTRL